MKNNPAKGQIRNIVIIFISIAALMVTSAVIELKQSKKELLQLMTTQAHSLLESLIITSKNTLQSYEYLENIERQRLLGSASFVRELYEKGALTNKILREIAEQNNIYQISIINKQRRHIFSSVDADEKKIQTNNMRYSIFEPLFNNQQDTLYIGLKPAAQERGYRYALALANRDRSVVVLNVDAGHFLEFKKKIGFGALLRSVVRGNPSVIYIALQDTTAILAGSGKLSFLSPILQSEFLKKAYADTLLITHTVGEDSSGVFEAIHPFIYKKHSVGLFRLGLSMEPIYDINERIFHRLIIITIVLVIIGFILFTYIFTRQRLEILHKQYQVVETYSSSIVDNVSDAIIVYNNDDGIMICNDAAAALFSKKRSDVLQKQPQALFADYGCRKIIEREFDSEQVVCNIENRKRYLFISKSQFYDSNEIVNTILVIRDLTEQKNMEEKMARKQRLTAMGELASGVAHEIRNPLNAIGTIVQQLDKDFEAEEEQDEYHELLKIVYSEVNRINETVREFLRFARPEPVSIGEFKLDDLINELGVQYKNLLNEKMISLVINNNLKNSVVWDRNQIKQALINILLNAVDAIGENGRIIITTESAANGEVVIRIEDNGAGMSDNVAENIFNLYYTTKAKGAGIGLSIVQRIVYEHRGLITVESEEGKGTAFILNIPISPV